MRIVERKNVHPFLEKRKLLKQYQKAVLCVYHGFYKQVDFKKRMPKTSGIYSFRINKQYRALCIIEKDTIIVFDIDDHQ